MIWYATVKKFVTLVQMNVHSTTTNTVKIVQKPVENVLRPVKAI